MTTLPSPDPVLDLDVCTLAAATRRGDLTCAEVTQIYLSRLRDLNPHLHAVISINEQAGAQADALDNLPDDQRGVLHGVPMLIKDNIDVAGLPTTAGSLRMRLHIPAADSPVVARLRAAGAIILGKANMTEWANFMTLGMPNGYSALGGQTVNPWGAGLDTGGSSSGCGVAVAARMCAAAIGTETSGSVVSPAHQCGVIGLKPTLGLVPRTGLIPMSHSQDTAGPLTRSVRDAALIMSVISGPDLRDDASLHHVAPQFRLTAGVLPQARAALMVQEPGVTPREQAAAELVQATLQELGANVQAATFPSRGALSRQGWMLDVLMYEFAHDLNAYLSHVTGGPHSLTEIIEGNDKDAEASLRYGQTLLYAAQGTRGDLGEYGYALARERDLLLCRTQGFDELFAQGFDLVIFPGIHGYDLAAKAGYPSLALPVPLSPENSLDADAHPLNTQPGGVLLVAPAGADAYLLSVAAELNRALGGVRFPLV